MIPRSLPRARLLSVSLLLCLAGLPALAQEKAIDRLRKDVAFLASEECEGRGVGTKGIDLAADYIAEEFRGAGLKPGLGEKGYFQPFSMHGLSKKEGESRLTLHGPAGQQIQLRHGTDFQALGMSGSGTAGGALVFAGYGASVKDIDYDDFADIDVKGKVVVLLRRVPRWDSDLLPFDGKKKDVHAALVNKFANAETRHAGAVILVNDFSESGSKPADAFIPFATLANERPRSIPVLQMRRDVLDGLLRTTLNQSLRDIERAIDRDLKPRSADLVGWRADVGSGVSRQSIAVKNVVGVLEGAGPRADETIVIGAHYDHLGWGGPGSLARGVKAIHHGADDNASGTSALMELARRFGQVKDRQGRRLVFIAFSAEERGLLGSRHYCDKEPLFPLESTTTMFNLDMVGRMKVKDDKDLLLVEGAGTSKSFAPLLTELNNPSGLELKLAKALMPNSDHFPFFNKKIPILFFWTGTHPEYHRPTDTADRINYEGMVKIVELSEKVIARLARDAHRPEFTPIPLVGSGGRCGAPRLGIAPGDYGADKKGLLVGAVTEGGAAQKAGLKGGDVIVEIAGQPVLNIDTYIYLMRQQRVGRPVEIGVLRGDKKLTFKVVPR